MKEEEITKIEESIRYMSKIVLINSITVAILATTLLIDMILR